MLLNGCQPVVGVERGAQDTFGAMITIHVQTVILHLIILHAHRHLTSQ